MGLGFRVQGSGFGVFGLRNLGTGFRIYGLLRSRVQDLELKVRGYGLGLRVKG